MLSRKLFFRSAVSAAFIVTLTFFGAVFLQINSKASAWFSQTELTHDAGGTQVAQRAPQNPHKGLTPSRALSNGKPTLFYFYPVDSCQMRYCRQPFDVAAKLEAQFGDQVNFVAVGLKPISDTQNLEELPGQNLVPWDVYPVEPYIDWLPEPMLLTAGENQHYAVIVLVDKAGRAVVELGEFFRWDELNPHLVAMPSITLMR